VTNSKHNLSELPKGWACARLDDVSDIIRGISFPKDAKTKTYQEGYIACLRTANVQREVDWSDLWFVPSEFVRRDQQLLQEHDILISTANSLELVGKVCQVRILTHPATLGAFIAAIRISPLVNPKFFYFQIASSDIQASIRACASTTTNISNVNTNRLKEIQLFTSPLNEQKRIVAKIEELFTRLDAGIEALKKVKAELKRYRQAVLKYAFEGKLTAEWREKNKDKLEPASNLLERIAKEREKNTKDKAKKLPPLDTSNLPELPEGWEWTKVHSVCETTSGGTPSRRKPEYYGGDIPWLKSGELNDGIVKSAEETITRHGLENSSAKIFPKGTLLIALYGATVGKLGILGIDAVTNQAICAIFTPKQLDDKYLFLYLANYRNKLLNLRIGGAQPNISQQIIRDIPFPITDFKEQRQIVAEIERHFSIADEVEQTVEKCLKEADRLRQSILKRAFEGKLVEQNPEDEPAEKLLERIKAEKAKLQNEQKTKKRGVKAREGK